MDNKGFWNIVAPLYSRFMRNNETVYKQSCSLIATHINPNMKVLELACGTGEFTEILADFVGEYIATDFSEAMVCKGRGKSQKRNVEFMVEDATNLTFEANSFDAVLIANSLHVMPNPQNALREIHRVLNKGGLLFAPTFIFDSNRTKLRVRLLELIGFRVYNKWREDDLLELISKSGFKTISHNKIVASPLSELVIISQKA